MWIHVFPVNDKYEHSTGDDYICNCNPSVDWENNIVSHNAYDFRDIEEFVNENYSKGN
jgi:hypothetical protein